MRKLFCFYLLLSLALPFDLFGQSIPTDFVRIRNRWKPDHYLNIEKGPLVAGLVQEGYFSAMWTLQPVGDGVHYRIQNRWKPDVFIHLEQPQLEAGPIHAGAWSAMWVLEKVGDGIHFRLKNRWKGDQYLHVETGTLQAGPIHAGAWSAMWIFQPLNAWPGDTAQPAPNPPSAVTTNNPVSGTPGGIPLINEHIQKKINMHTSYFFYQAWNGNVYAARILPDNTFLLGRDEKFEDPRKRKTIDVKGAYGKQWRVSIANGKFMLQQNGEGPANPVEELDYLSVGNAQWKLQMSRQSPGTNRSTLSATVNVTPQTNPPPAVWSNPESVIGGLAPNYQMVYPTYFPDVVFYNSGAYVAKYQVDWYDVAGNPHTWHSGDTPVAQGRAISFLQESREKDHPDIDFDRQFRVRGWTYTGLVWEPNRLIFDHTVSKILYTIGSDKGCYKTFGTTLGPGFDHTCDRQKFQIKGAPYRLRIN